MRSGNGTTVGFSGREVNITRELRILYAGELQAGSTASQRAQALEDLGHRVTKLNTARETEFVVEPSFLSRVQRKIFGVQDQARANERIVKSINADSFDLMWIDKGLTISLDTLQMLRLLQPQCRIVGYSPDDMMNPGNQTCHFLGGLPLYHAFITTKSYNVPELRALGCHKVIFIDNSYDPHTHRPILIEERERNRMGGPVGFVGQWEPERADSIRKLALTGIPIRVWGMTWQRMGNLPQSLTLEHVPVWGEDYARALSSFDINLCFLRKCNRDLQTSRTIEIPACRGFMLAERTEEHKRLFEEGQEAEFFGDDDELIDKVRYYLAHPDERRRIAERGYERCLHSGYSYAARLEGALEKLYDQNPH